jgi:hypothetical protein
MIAWMLGAFAGPPALAGLAVCLCRRRRRHRRLTRDQIAESELLTDLERRENWNHPTPGHQRPGRLPRPLVRAALLALLGLVSLIVSPVDRRPVLAGRKRSALALAGMTVGYAAVSVISVLFVSGLVAFATGNGS